MSQFSLEEMWTHQALKVIALKLVLPLDQWIDRLSIDTKDDAMRARYVEVKKLFDAAPRPPSAASAAVPAIPSSSEDWDCAIQ